MGMPRQNTNCKTSSSSVPVSYLINLLHAKLEDPRPNLEIQSCLRISWGFVIIGAKDAGSTCVFVNENSYWVHWRGEKDMLYHVVIYIYTYKSVFFISIYLRMVWVGWTQHLSQTFASLTFPPETCANIVLEVPHTVPLVGDWRIPRQVKAFGIKSVYPWRQREPLPLDLIGEKNRRLIVAFLGGIGGDGVGGSER